MYTIEKTKKDEHERNRSRISEIWTFVERVKEEIEETRKFITSPEEFYED